jgi:phosphoribosylaminoimidazole (AIR) synthetase
MGSVRSTHGPRAAISWAFAGLFPGRTARPGLVASTDGVGTKVCWGSSTVDDCSAGPVNLSVSLITTAARPLFFLTTPGCARDRPQ